MRQFIIEFEVEKKVGDDKYGLEINPFDFLDLINAAEEEEGFRLETTEDGIRCMINDEEICEMIIWIKDDKQQERTDI